MASSNLTLDTMLSEVQLSDFTAAAARIAPHVTATPLLPFHGKTDKLIRLKAENLQPLGSFKIRAAFNALLEKGKEQLSAGVATASAGNFAQGLTLAAAYNGAKLTVHVPETAAQVKRDALVALGATVIVHPFNDWWRILSTRDTGNDDGLFVHPVSDPAVVIGNGTIGLELIDSWPELDTVVIPFGGGGLATGIALAIRASGRKVRIIACEVETATPLSSAFAAGSPVPVERKPSFIDGIGSNRVLEEMWPLLRELIDDVIVVTTEEARLALRALAEKNHLLVEGAAAVALAAAQSPRCEGKNVAAILSGGNIDRQVFCDIFTA